LAGSGIPFTDLASIGWIGGITGRSTPLTLVFGVYPRLVCGDRSPVGLPAGPA
jgi:hypothetical protein